MRRFSPEAVPETAALLVVDLQRGFMNDETRSAPAAIGRFLDRHCERFRLVIASRFRNTEGCPTRLLLDSDSVASDEEAELCDELRRPGLQVLEKTTYALGEPLGALLRRHAVEQLFICGVDTHACVLHEALDAFDRCIRPVVLADLCASGDGDEAHAAALAVLRRAIGVHNVWTLGEDD